MKHRHWLSSSWQESSGQSRRAPSQRAASLAAALLLSTAVVAPAAEFYVSAGNATGTELGTQRSPFRTVQAGIDAAADGDTVRVAAGTYVENLRIESKALVLEGAYSSAWARDLDSNLTTLSGAGGDAVITLIAADATVDGFRITRGTGSVEELPYGYHGGGIYSRDGSPTLLNNIIECNDILRDDQPSDYNFGGGVYVTNAARATILGNVVRGNSAGRGGGISVSGQEALIEGNTIENNVAIGDHGGGLFIAVVSATVTQNLIRRNEVGRDLGYGWGGGLIVVNAGNSAELSFNVVSENYAAAYGAGEFVDEGAEADIHHELIVGNVSKDGCETVSAIAVDGGDGVGSRATIAHCTIAGNICANPTRGNGLQVEGQSVVTVINSIFWNNGEDEFTVDDTSTLNVSYTSSFEALPGTGNISADPLFLDEPEYDYRLAAGSPCIDAGDPASAYGDEPGDNGGRADMGRYGNAPPAPPPEPARDGAVVCPDGGDDGAGSNGAGTNTGACGAGAGSAAATMLLFFSLIGARRGRRRAP
jgi:hypothetical protein